MISFPLPEWCALPDRWPDGCNRCPKNRTCNPPPSQSDAEWDRRHPGPGRAEADEARERAAT